MWLYSSEYLPLVITHEKEFTTGTLSCATHTFAKKMQMPPKRQFTCKHELGNVWLHMQTRKERERTLGLVDFLLDAT